MKTHTLHSQRAAWSYGRVEYLCAIAIWDLVLIFCCQSFNCVHGLAFHDNMLKVLVSFFIKWYSQLRAQQLLSRIGISVQGESMLNMHAH
ncbi:CLUMA_CG006372, isoform A [Clunio marinus]|uniref:CLUMA_CG006372, isoform A n=1 Tax=Clunio marinus TaxID=568069 RepID=A0A1J1HXV9_9DIPT|nr:CLUMA_CG006372, isoform A [Clunio marinus]